MLRKFKDVGLMEQMQKLVNNMQELGINRWVATLTEKECEMMITPFLLVCSNKHWLNTKEWEYMNPYSVFAQLLYKMGIVYTAGTQCYLLQYNIPNPRDV